jgi:hypothetical protein
MSTIVTRAGKGSPLTHTEVDTNFTNLNTDKLQSGSTASSLVITSADINGGSIDGTTIGASTASTGAFTSLTSSSTTTLNGTTIPSSKTLVVTTDIGSTVQAYDAQLADVAGLTPTDNSVIIGNGTNFVVESGSTLRTSLGLAIGTDVQAYSDELQGASQGGISGMKNRLINGAMVVDQRNVGASVSVTSGTTKYSVDMFRGDSGGGLDGVFSMQQSTTVPSSGFKNSLALTVTTANTNSGSGRYYRMYSSIEGLNMADLNVGTASAATVTLSFWVRSSVTGTYCVGFQNASFNRSYAANYTINTANTWEKKSITLIMDTTGTWSNSNTLGVRLFWDLGSGSSFQQTANTWAASNTWLTSSQTNWINNSGATFYITGVQLEKGSTATSFDYKLFQAELDLCQRYFEKSFSYEIAPAHNTGGLFVIPIGSSFGCGGNAYFTVQLKTHKRNRDYTLRHYDPLASHSNSENWLRAITDCASGTAYGPNSNFVAENYATGQWSAYAQVGTGIPPIMNWTVESEL